MEKKIADKRIKQFVGGREEQCHYIKVSEGCEEILAFCREKRGD